MKITFALTTLLMANFFANIHSASAFDYRELGFASEMKARTEYETGVELAKNMGFDMKNGTLALCGNLKYSLAWGIEGFFCTTFKHNFEIDITSTGIEGGASLSGALVYFTAEYGSEWHLEEKVPIYYRGTGISFYNLFGGGIQGLSQYNSPHSVSKLGHGGSLYVIKGGTGFEGTFESIRAEVLPY